MRRVQQLSPMWLAVMVAIGCGGTKPESASATTERSQQAQEPARLVQAPVGGGPVAGGSSRITGTVRLIGQAPQASAIRMDADPACQQQHATPVFSEEVVVNPNGALKHVFVYIKEGLQGSFQAPAVPVVLGQSGCWYQPHVFGVQTGQPLEIVNSDATLHNVNAKPASNQPFNIAQPVKGMKSTKKFTKPEVMVKFKCNVHPWMSAYLGVLDHPFFSVSGDDGAFSIPNLPAGTYVIEAWHERYGTQTETVGLGGGETKTVEFTFSAQ